MLFQLNTALWDIGNKSLEEVFLYFSKNDIKYSISGFILYCLLVYSSLT